MLVAVHGWLLSGRLWDPLLDHWQGRWSCWCPDLPGFGGSSRPPGLQPSLASYGRWLAAAVQQQAAGAPVVLIGHSLGGSIALHAAALSGRDGSHVVAVSVHPCYDFSSSCAYMESNPSPRYKPDVQVNYEDMTDDDSAKDPTGHRAAIALLQKVMSP
jgi:pimeloyl-ACP methyl ester carboxylesterase